MSAAALPHGRREPALGPSLALSALAHVILIGVLFIGVRFQSSTPATVEVELWQPPPPPPPAPVVEQPKPPPPPVVKPEPEPEVKKPEIALPDKPKPKPKPEPKKPEPKKVEVKPKPKPEPKPKPDLALEKLAREEAAREQQQLAAEDKQRQERQMQEMLARQQAAAAQAARDKALATWTDKIRGKIRGNIILPRDIPGNPEAIFDVAILPTGEVLTVRKRKSSGHPAYDDAVERAIMKSSPLPLPDDRSLFRRDLELKFRPQDR
jgi:colicin import membrane protein